MALMTVQWDRPRTGEFACDARDWKDSKFIFSSRKISMDDKDITTPYYPYKNKKRKPLLNISP